tara:strand:- start:4787 stop:5236 length:450 start_codon:yes stop_codon:yes gene_type:complete
MAQLRPFNTTVDLFREACTLHTYVQTFDFGGLDYLDASSQNVAYPYVFLRPMPSPGLIDRVRTLTFEMYCLDVPTLANQSPLNLISNMEQVSYDIGAFFNRGPYQQEIEFQMIDMIPIAEAFNDRAFGWVSNINIIENGIFDYCYFPKE